MFFNGFGAQDLGVFKPGSRSGAMSAESLQGLAQGLWKPCRDSEVKNGRVNWVAGRVQTFG